MTFQIKHLLLIIFAVGALGACTKANFGLRTDTAQRLATPSFMVKREIPAGAFSLTAYERMHERYAPANVYIEGHGETVLKDLTIDPTPRNPVALHLSSRDKAENLAWLAGPCQYSAMVDDTAACDKAYWNGKTFSPDVLQSYNRALDDIKAQYNITTFNLIGFDSGAGVAALLAANRDDVTSLRTVAGVLEHNAYTAYHQKAAYGKSLNPTEFSGRLRNIPQYHFIGGQDDVVTPAVLHSYLQAVGSSNCVQHKLIQEASHREGWVNKWPELLAMMPVCTGPAEAVVFDDYIAPQEPIRIRREGGKGVKGR